VGGAFVFTSIFHGQHAVLEMNTIKLSCQHWLCGWRRWQFPHLDRALLPSMKHSWKPLHPTLHKSTNLGS